MPWTGKDATGHTKKAAGSPRAKSVWAKVANNVLAAGKSEGSAVRIANAQIAKMFGAPKRS